MHLYAKKEGETTIGHEMAKKIKKCINTYWVDQKKVLLELI